MRCINVCQKKTKNGLSNVYDEALERIGHRHGTKIALVVRAVIMGKQQIEMLQGSIPPAAMTIIVELVSSNIGAMCSLIDAEFNKEILPLVDSVTKEVTTKARKNLQ
jgi:hypothetical protein